MEPDILPTRLQVVEPAVESSAGGGTPLPESAEDAEDRREGSSRQRSRRVAALDAFRGFTILGMLLVNNAALDVATPEQLVHAPWNRGIHFADMVFPWFLLIVGVAVPYSIASHQRKGLAGWRYDVRAAGRAAALVLLGCLIDSSLAKHPVFDMGVLQLIGLAYLAGALLYELSVRRRLILAGALLVAHWFAIRFVPIPGAGAGVFTETTNLVNHLNRVYLQPLGLRGIISVVPTSALVLIGTALGDVLRNESRSSIQKVGHLLAAGIALMAIGWLWSLDLPFNKPVWTSSYILFAAGWGSILLGFFYLLIDANGWRAWAFPLVVPGTNAIFAYVVPILVKIDILQLWSVKAGAGPAVSVQQAFMNSLFLHFGRIPGGWVYTIAYITFWWLVLLALHRKNVFLRV